MKIIHFDARSVIRKWDKLRAEIEASSADIYCISESWLRETDNKELYMFKNFAAYSNCRPNKSGGVILLAKPTLWSALHPLMRQVSLSDGYN